MWQDMTFILNPMIHGLKCFKWEMITTYKGKQVIMHNARLPPLQIIVKLKSI
jgi:hypothetical protein